jgi:copper chaperone CopZ
MVKPRGKARAILRIDQHHISKDVAYSKIEDSIKNLPGVSRARINYVTSTVEVDYDPEKLTLEKIRETLQTLSNDVV